MRLFDRFKSLLRLMLGITYSYARSARSSPGPSEPPSPSETSGKKKPETPSGSRCSTSTAPLLRLDRESNPLLSAINADELKDDSIHDWINDELRPLKDTEIPLLCAVCNHVFYADVLPAYATGVPCPSCGAAAGMLPG